MRPTQFGIAGLQASRQLITRLATLFFLLNPLLLTRAGDCCQEISCMVLNVPRNFFAAATFVMEGTQITCPSA
jgi:hypothetical protein